MLCSFQCSVNQFKNHSFDTLVAIKISGGLLWLGMGMMVLAESLLPSVGNGARPQVEPEVLLRVKVSMAIMVQRDLSAALWHCRGDASFLIL